VLVTATPSGRSDTLTRTVLQNITVLSAGQTIQADGKSQSISTPVVTLLVNPEEAELLTLANSEGHIQLVLRNSSDQKTEGGRSRHLLDLFGSLPAEPVKAEESRPRPAPRAPAPVAVRPVAPRVVDPPAAEPAPPPKPEQVLLIRGNVRTLEAPAPKIGDSK
jgi:pilus assembly protein CpaB